MPKPIHLWFLLAVGCGGTGSPVPGGELPGRKPPGENAGGIAAGVRPRDPLTPEQQTIADTVTQDLLEQLEDAIGQFAAGRSPVFRGVFSARDNLGSVPFNRQDGVMANAEVLAALERREDLWTGQTPDRGLRLFIVSETQGKSLRLSQHEQQTGITHVSLVQPKSAGGGLEAACSGCVAPFTSATSSIDVAPLIASGKWGDGSPMRVTAEGTLAQIPPGQLTYEDLRSIARSDYERERLITGFAARGAERIQQITGTHRAPAQVPSGTHYAECERVTPYSVELYLGPSVADFGIRAFSAEPTLTCCLDRPRQPCDPQTPTCF